MPTPERSRVVLGAGAGLCTVFAHTSNDDTMQLFPGLGAVHAQIGRRLAPRTALSARVQLVTFLIDQPGLGEQRSAWIPGFGAEEYAAMMYGTLGATLQHWLSGRWMLGGDLFYALVNDLWTDSGVNISASRGVGGAIRAGRRLGLSQFVLAGDLSPSFFNRGAFLVSASFFLSWQP